MNSRARGFAGVDIAYNRCSNGFRSSARAKALGSLRLDIDETLR